ncbi:MAG: hypothetical protein KA886_05485 [Candidatus Cloacimonetes bacterium]|nr:hypothetical protein [Candidatus Cloacimonadota bacterium]
MKVYMTHYGLFPKRMDQYIMCYYRCQGDYQVILRRPVKREMQAQNQAIKTNHSCLLQLWAGVSLRIKQLFAVYADKYRKIKLDLRRRGISAFSIFIRLMYRLSKRFQIEIGEMDYDFLTSFFMQYSTFSALFKAGLLEYVPGFRNKAFKSFLFFSEKPIRITDNIIEENQVNVSKKGEQTEYVLKIKRKFLSG